MSRIKRTKEIKIRLTPAEHDQLQEMKQGAELATWLRRLALNQPVKDKPKIKTVVHTADPELLRQIARIGANMNQIAYHANRGDISSARILLELATIREHLSRIIEREAQP